MKITLFTSNKIRHEYLISLLSKSCDKLFVIQESKLEITGNKLSENPKSDLMTNYFENVEIAQRKIFLKSEINLSFKNVKILKISRGELNSLTLDFLSEYLKSDCYVVFGSSYIKGELANFLISKKTINIHAGLSPYYRGTDCNFWALYDNNPHLVGATIHLLSKGLDNGPILYHAMPDLKSNNFEYTMSAVKSAVHSVAEKIKDQSIFKISATEQDRSKEIRYTKKNEFNDKILRSFMSKKIDLKSNSFDVSLLKNPYFL